MSNLRIIWDNAVDRATLTASSTAGALSVANLQTDMKSDVWRATGTSARLTTTWAALETIQGVALPFCNLSPTATMRVRVTSEAQATNLLVAPADFSNAAWTKSNVSIAAGVSGPDGTASATTITASASGGVLSQSQSVGSGNWVSSFYIRRRTGSGQVLIRNAANTAWIALTITSSWSRVTNDGGTASFSLASLQLAVVGDAIDIAFAQLESGATATSYYPGTRPLGYIDSWQSYTYDSGQVLACPAPAVTLRGWTAAQAASAYAYGGGSYARTWLPTAVQGYGMAVDIVDVSNVQGYIEAARLVAGPYWSPTDNASKASMTVVDTTELYRTDAGDQGAAASYQYRRVPIDLSLMPASDRRAFVSVIRNSRAYPVLLSVFPESADLALERDHMIYGRRSKDSDIAIEYATLYSTTIELEEI